MVLVSTLSLEPRPPVLSLQGSSSKLETLYLHVVQDGSQTESKVKLRHGDAVHITTLAGNVQLDAMRSFLGSGFQSHMQQNPFLHTVFRFRPQEDPADRLTPAEKRMMRSPSSVSSKLRSQSLRRVQGSRGVLLDDGTL